MAWHFNANGDYVFERGGPGIPTAQGGDIVVSVADYNTAISRWASFQNAPTSIGQAPIILFNQQPAPLTSGGVTIPNSTVAFKNPA